MTGEGDTLASARREQHTLRRIGRIRAPGWTWRVAMRIRSADWSDAGFRSGRPVAAGSAAAVARIAPARAALPAAAAAGAVAAAAGATLTAAAATAAAGVGAHITLVHFFLTLIGLAQVLIARVRLASDVGPALA